MRVFIALALPKRFVDDTAEVARILKGQLMGRFVPREHYHITLAFLGDIPAPVLDDVFDVVDRASDKSSAIRLEADGLGIFGKRRDATLWLGLLPNRPMEELADSVRSGLKGRHVDFDAKPFKPHITLARRANIPKGDFPPLAFPEEASADTLCVFKSTLEKAGARYKLLYSATLQKTDCAL